VGTGAPVVAVYASGPPGPVYASGPADPAPGPDPADPSPVSDPVIPVYASAPTDSAAASAPRSSSARRSIVCTPPGASRGSSPSLPPPTGSIMISSTSNRPASSPRCPSADFGAPIIQFFDNSSLTLRL